MACGGIAGRDQRAYIPYPFIHLTHLTREIKIRDKFGIIPDCHGHSSIRLRPDGVYKYNQYHETPTFNRCIIHANAARRMCEQAPARESGFIC